MLTVVPPSFGLHLDSLGMINKTTDWSNDAESFDRVKLGLQVRAAVTGVAWVTRYPGSGTRSGSLSGTRVLDGHLDSFGYPPGTTRVAYSDGYTVTP